VWTNSVFGRILGTGLGLCLIVLSFNTEPDETARHGTSLIIVDALVAITGALVIVAFWTSRLRIADGNVTATNFFISRSMPLIEVAAAEPSTFPFLGIKIQRKDGSGIRSLVSGQSWDELWTPRATKIAGDIEDLAKLARGELTASGDMEPATSKGSTGRGRHARQ
jgi:hypothetical protein